MPWLTAAAAPQVPSPTILLSCHVHRLLILLTDEMPTFDIVSETPIHKRYGKVLYALAVFRQCSGSGGCLLGLTNPQTRLHQES